MLHAHYYKSGATTECAVEVRKGDVIIVDFAIVCHTFSDIAKYVCAMVRLTLGN